MKREINVLMILAIMSIQAVLATAEFLEICEMDASVMLMLIFSECYFAVCEAEENRREEQERKERQKISNVNISDRKNKGA